MVSQRFRNGVAASVGVATLVIGLAAPALAASRSDVIDNKKDGWASSHWNDTTSTNETRVTVQLGCSREFQARLRKDRTGLPDATVGSEWINCFSYDDAVRSDGNPSTGDYHYDINGMDGSCFCDYTTTAFATVYW
jgi:hypothetical protein